MNKYIIVFSLLALLFPFTAKAQSSAVKQINAIKRDTTYLYAEATMQTWDEAYSGAKAILEATIQDWAKDQKMSDKASAFLAKSDKKILEIKTQRGNYIRAFLYVKKSDIVPVGKSQEVMVIDNSKGNGKPIEIKPLKEDKARKRDIDQARNGNISSKVEQVQQPQVVQLSNVEEQILSVTTFQDIQPLVEDLKGQGVLADYGKYKTLPQSGTCYLYIYNRSGQIPAVLKKTDNNVFNLKTQQEDNINKYKDCGAFWLRLKQ